MTNITKISIAVLAILALLVGGWLAFRNVGGEIEDETTTTIESTTEAPMPDPVVIPISTAALIAQFANSAHEVVQEINTVDGANRPQNRTFTGVAIRDILAWQGVDLYTIDSNAVLNVGGSMLEPAVFLAPTTLLAWHEINHDNDNAAAYLTNARLIFGDEQGMLWGAYRQNIIELTLEF